MRITKRAILAAYVTVSVAIATQQFESKAAEPTGPADTGDENRIARELVREKANIDIALKNAGVISVTDEINSWPQQVDAAAKEIASKFTHYLRLKDQLGAQLANAFEIHGTDVIPAGRRNWRALYASIHTIQDELKRTAKFALGNNEPDLIKRDLENTRKRLPDGSLEPRPVYTTSAAAPDQKILAIRRRIVAATILSSEPLTAVQQDDRLSEAIKSFKQGGEVRPPLVSADFDSALERLETLGMPSDNP